MATPRGAATTSQEKDTNKSSRTPQPPPGWPYNGPKGESLFVSQGESEHNSRHDSDSAHESQPNGEDTLYWPCSCRQGYNGPGEWILCENSNCRIKWYHLVCVGLNGAPAEKWICRQCRARTRKVAVAKPDPKKKGIAIKVTPKKGQGRRRSGRELPSDEGEEFKRKVDSAREVKILPGKTRSGAGQDPVYSEDESETTETEYTPQQKTRRRSSARQVDTTRTNTNPLGSDADSHVSTPGRNFDAKSPKGLADAHSQVSMPGENFNGESSKYPANTYSQGSTPGKNFNFDTDSSQGAPDLRAFRNNRNVNDRNIWEPAEDLAPLPYCRSPPTPAPGSTHKFTSSENSEDEWDRDPKELDEAARVEQAAAENESTSLAEDLTDSQDWETVDTGDETANDSGESTPRPTTGAKRPPTRSFRPSTPEAASTMTGEPHRAQNDGPVNPTEGDQALMAAMRGSWVGQYFA